VARISIDLRDRLIKIIGETEGMILLPKYVIYAIDTACGSTYITEDHRDFIKCLDKLRNYVESTPYDNWFEALQQEVPRRYVRKLVEWLELVKSYVEDMAALVAGGVYGKD